MKFFQQAFENKRLTFLFILLATVFIYLPSISGTFLHTDDWFWSFWGGFSCRGVVNWIIPIGRPLAGFIYCLFPLVKRFSEMWIFRFINILNIVFIGFLLWRWMIRWKVEAFAAFLITILTVTLPAFQVYSSYISTMPHCFAVTMSFLAVFFADDSLKAKTRPSRLKLQSLAVLFLISSLSLNQASALFYIGALAIPLLMADSATFLKVWPKRLVQFAIILLCALAIYYLVFRVSAGLFQFRNVGKYDGRNFVQNYGERIRWFFTDPLFEASNLWFINPTPFLRTLISVAMLCLFGWDFFTEPRKGGRRAVVIKYLAVLALFPLGYFISLVSSNPSKEYRTYAVLGSVFIFFLFLGFYSIEVRRNQGKVRTFALMLFLVFSVGASVIAHNTVSEYFVLSDSAEFRFVKNEIRNYLARGKELKKIHIIVAHGPIAAPQQRNEIGEPTIRHTPNIEPLLWAALSELGYYEKPQVTTGQTLEDPTWVGLTFDYNTIDLSQTTYPPSKDGVLIIDVSSFRFI